MSACLDLHFVCSAPIDFTQDISPLCAKYDFSVNGITAIDDWRWNHPAEIELLSDIGEVLESGRIVVIRLINRCTATPACIWKRSVGNMSGRYG